MVVCNVLTYMLSHFSCPNCSTLVDVFQNSSPSSKGRNRAITHYPFLILYSAALSI